MSRSSILFPIRKAIKWKILNWKNFPQDFGVIQWFGWCWNLAWSSCWVLIWLIIGLLLWVFIEQWWIPSFPAMLLLFFTPWIVPKATSCAFIAFWEKLIPYGRTFGIYESSYLFFWFLSSYKLLVFLYWFYSSFSLNLWAS